MEEKIIDLFGSIDAYYYSANYFKYYLNLYKDKNVRIRVNSLGGNVDQAVAISTLMQKHGNVTVEFIGFVASAATWLAFGAKKIEAHEDCMWLAHKSSIGVDIWGSLKAEDLEAKIKELQSAKQSADAIDLMIAKKYADRSGKSIQEVMSLMEEEKWISAEDAQKWGFIDTILEGKAVVSTNMAHSFSNDFAALGLPLPSIMPVGSNVLHNNIEMKKDYLMVNQILNVEGFDAQEDKVTLTLDQMEALNKAIQEAQDKVTASEAKVAELNKSVETANAATAEANNKVTELTNKVTEAENNVTAINAALDEFCDEVKEFDATNDKLAVIKEHFDQLPAVSVNNNADGATVDFSEFAKDPINNFYD